MRRSAASTAVRPLPPELAVQGYLNVFRDPTNPFSANSPIYFTNVTNINNKGWGAHYSPTNPDPYKAVDVVEILDTERL